MHRQPLGREYGLKHIGLDRNASTSEIEIVFIMKGDEMPAGLWTIDWARKEWMPAVGIILTVRFGKRPLRFMGVTDQEMRQIGQQMIAFCDMGNSHHDCKAEGTCLEARYIFHDQMGEPYKVLEQFSEKQISERHAGVHVRP